METLPPAVRHVSWVMTRVLTIRMRTEREAVMQNRKRDYTMPLVQWRYMSSPGRIAHSSSQRMSDEVCMGKKEDSLPCHHPSC